MRVTDNFPAGGFLTGARTLVIRSVPKGATIRSARLTITPIADQRGNVGPAIEELSFLDANGVPSDTATDPDDRDRPTGVTRTVASGAPPWTEINFHTLRTLDSLEGGNLDDATLQVDLGGLFVDVGENGTVPSDEDPFRLAGGAPDLPGLRVQRIKVTATTTGTPPAPNVTGINLRAVASNLTLAIANQPPVWAHPGEVGASVETTELAEFVQAALDAAPDEAGFATIPMTLKSDTTARLSVSAAIVFDEASDSLPGNLPEVKLDYDHGAASEGGDDVLRIAVPAGMTVDPSTTRVEVAGSFEASEITYGPLVDRDPAAALDLRPGMAAAHPVAAGTETVADAIDLLLSTPDRNVAVEVDLREDFDGKPGSVSLLKARAPVTLDISSHGKARWVSAAFGQSVTLPAADPATGKPRFWAVVQSTAGTARWHLNPAKGGAAELLTSDNGGLSWRPARVAGTAGALGADLRLRHATPGFRVPISVEIGRGANSRLLDLKKFQPLGRVEFALDAGQFADAVNDVLAAERTGTCPRGEQLVNGSFADRDADIEVYTPAGWTASGGPVGRRAISAGSEAGLRVTLLVIGDAEGPPRAISQVLPVSSGCPYELTFRGFQRRPGARVELIWRSEGCGVSAVETLEPPVIAPSFGTVGVTTAAATHATLAFLPAARLRSTAPADARQAEVRVISEDGQEVFTDEVSLVAGPQSLANPDLREIRRADAEEGPGFVGWTIGPEGALADDGFSVRATAGRIIFVSSNREGRQLFLSQRVPVSPGAAFAAEIVARAETGSPEATAPSASLVWTDAGGATVGVPLRAGIAPGNADTTRLRGTVPDGAETAEFRIVIEPETALAIGSVRLDVREPTIIPIAFLAQSPGALTVRDFTVGFGEAPAPVPPAPPAGPCLPTPADAAPGDVCDCDPCGKPPPQAEPGFATASRNLLLRGVSATVRLAAAAERRFSAIRPGDLPAAAFGAPDRPLEPASAVIDVDEIGPVRSEALAGIGVTTVRHLALADPRDLERRLGFHRSLAEDVVRRARAMVSADLSLNLRPAADPQARG